MKADVLLAPAWATPDSIEGSGTVKTEDAGQVVRLTPINTMDAPGILVIDYGFGGFRYDHAVVPQARVLDHVKPAGVTVFVRPLEIIAAR